MRRRLSRVTDLHPLLQSLAVSRRLFTPSRDGCLVDDSSVHHLKVDETSSSSIAQIDGYKSREHWIKLLDMADPVAWPVQLCRGCLLSSSVELRLYKFQILCQTPRKSSNVSVGILIAIWAPLNSWLFYFYCLLGIKESQIRNWHKGCMQSLPKCVSHNTKNAIQANLSLFSSAFQR